MAKSKLELANEKAAEIKKEYDEKTSIHIILRYNAVLEDIRISAEKIIERESKNENARFDIKTHELLGVSKSTKTSLDKINEFKEKLTKAFDKAVADNSLESYLALEKILDDEPNDLTRRNSEARIILEQFELSEDPIVTFGPWGFMLRERRRHYL